MAEPRRILPPEITGVGLFCLSNAPDEQSYRRGLDTLATLGLDAIHQPELPVPLHRQFAGDDEYRAASFNRAVAAPGTQLLMAVRGGSGAARALPYIDFQALRASGKWLCGYSDTTALLLAAAARGCRRLIHGPMLCSSLGTTPDAPVVQQELTTLAAVLEGRRELLPPWATPRILRPGSAQGTLFAANLTLLQTLLGTPYLPELRGAILVLEDVNAPAHDIDRKLNHLRQAGILEELAALAFGSFTQAEDAQWIPEILAEYARCVKGPVVADFPLGHHHPSAALPCNCPARLNATPDAIQLLRM